MSETLTPRLRRTMELVYAVEGVTAARIWHWPGKIAIAVRPSSASAPSELLARVEAAVAGIREPGETWEFGILDAT
jgi:hypothetical protein